jgi:hypothetical protein
MAAVPSGPSLDSTPHYTQIKKNQWCSLVTQVSEMGVHTKISPAVITFGPRVVSKKPFSEACCLTTLSVSRLRSIDDRITNRYEEVCGIKIGREN